MSENTQPPSIMYGRADATYQAVGGIEGITILVDAFYDYMSTLDEAKDIRAMHADDLTLSRKKLTYFLSGWMGGPRLYSEHFGSISIPGAHQHLRAETRHANAWMLCMQKALDDQPYSVALKQYLYEQLNVPARRVVEAGQVK